jgi:Icc-related predicted phosphoesterase
MKILVVSDHEEKQLYDHFDPERWVGRVDLAISCGDLRGEYLSYLVTVLRVPLLYVAGNHDTRYDQRPPDGCDRLDGKVVQIQGLRIAGLSGSPRYGEDTSEYQFSDRQIRWRIRKLGFAIRRAGGVEILVSHAAPIRCPFTPQICKAPAGAGHPCIHPEITGHPWLCPEPTDYAHRSVVAYNQAIARWKPRIWLHGHNHIEYGRVPRLWWVGETQVINADGHVLVDTDQSAERERGSILTHA